MKIGILSMQRIVNNGSFLQAYALKETLKMLSGYEPEFIDFENALQNKKNKEKVQNKKRKNLIKILFKHSEIILALFIFFFKNLLKGFLKWHWRNFGRPSRWTRFRPTSRFLRRKGKGGKAPNIQKSLCRARFGPAWTCGFRLRLKERRAR